MKWATTAALNMIMLGAVTATVGIVSEKALAQAIETVLEGKKRSLVEDQSEGPGKGIAVYLILTLKARILK